MFWFFEKQDSKLRYEIRGAESGAELELVITHPDGREEVEVYATPADALRRSERLERDLTAAGWQRPTSKGARATRPPRPSSGPPPRALGR